MFKVICHFQVVVDIAHKVDFFEIKINYSG